MTVRTLQFGTWFLIGGRGLGEVEKRCTNIELRSIQQANKDRKKNRTLLKINNK